MNMIPHFFILVKKIANWDFPPKKVIPSQQSYTVKENLSAVNKILWYRQTLLLSYEHKLIYFFQVQRGFAPKNISLAFIFIFCVKVRGKIKLLVALLFYNLCVSVCLSIPLSLYTCTHAPGGLLGHLREVYAPLSTLIIIFLCSFS